MHRVRNTDHPIHLPAPATAQWCTRLRYSILAAAASLLVSFLNLYAQQARPAEYQVKAAYLHNFGRFVEWPARFAETTDDFFSICVLGQDPFGAALDATLTGETIDSKSVVARRIVKSEDAVNCRILFISSSENNHLKEILMALDRSDVLTVSDMPRFSQRGGMIQFVLQGNRIRFEVNLAAAQGAGLTLSSELLKVAVTVRRNPQPGD